MEDDEEITRVISLSTSCPLKFKTLISSFKNGSDGKLIMTFRPSGITLTARGKQKHMVLRAELPKEVILLYYYNHRDDNNELTPEVSISVDPSEILAGMGRVLKAFVKHTIAWVKGNQRLTLSSPSRGGEDSAISAHIINFTLCPKLVLDFPIPSLSEKTFTITNEFCVSPKTVSGAGYKSLVLVRDEDGIIAKCISSSTGQATRINKYIVETFDPKPNKTGFSLPKGYDMDKSYSSSRPSVVIIEDHVVIPKDSVKCIAEMESLDTQISFWIMDSMYVIGSEISSLGSYKVFIFKND